MKNEILLADDEATFRETLSKVLREEGMNVTAVSNGIEAIRLGASEYVMKPVMFDDIIMKIRRQLQYRRLTRENLELKQQLDGKVGLEQIIGDAPVMQRVFETIRKVARTQSNVLITGRSGTGKELVAYAIHSLGPTASYRFVAVNCSAIAEGGLLFDDCFMRHCQCGGTHGNCDIYSAWHKAMSQVTDYLAATNLVTAAWTHPPHRFDELSSDSDTTPATEQPGNRTAYSA